MNQFSGFNNSPEDRENENSYNGGHSSFEKREEHSPGNGFQGNPFPYGYPYGGIPPYRRKPSVMQRITAFFTDKRVLPLSIASIAASLAIILFSVSGELFARIISSDDRLYALYTQDHMLEMVFGMAYTVLGIGLPFFLAFIFLKKADSVELPLGRPAKKSGTGFLIPAALGICYIGNVAVSWLMSMLSTVGISSHSYDMALTRTEPLPENVFQLICNIMYIAVFPAFFEEFAFRGVIMQPLRKYGDRFAIMVSAVLFGLVHGNIMQMPFAIVAGVALGYAGIVTGSMWTGIIIHFLNNFLSLLYTWAQQGLSASSAMIFSALFTYGIIFIGIVALAGYAWHNPDMLRLYPSKVKAERKGQFTAVYFLMPAMLVAIILMFRNILTDLILRG